MAQQREKKRLLGNKYRFSIFNDTSHKEVFVLRANGWALVISAVAFLLIIISSVALTISHTRLRELIPGYPNEETRLAITRNAIRADSLEREIKLWDIFLSNMQRVLLGQEPLNPEIFISEYINIEKLSDSLAPLTNKSDSSLKREVDRVARLETSAKRRTIEQLEGLHFFTPVKGVISNGYSEANNHPFLDIAAPANTPVFAILDGTVIFAAWNDKTGYNIHLQHDNNLVSIYKHNTKLLKKEGDKVVAGTAIAHLGSTGSLSSNNHLHFELWHKGVPIDPTKYIKF
ncbi:MAG: M23 family metallopeptidase [Bacteroidales bacterium]